MERNVDLTATDESWRHNQPKWSPSRYLYEPDLKGAGLSQTGRDSPEGRGRRSTPSRLVELTRLH